MKTLRHSTLLLLSSLLALALGSCGGSNINNPGGTQADNGVPSPGVGLPSSGTPDVAAVNGNITVKDFTVSDGTATPSSVKGGAAAAGGMQIMVRIINPGDDILSSVFTKSGQLFSMKLSSGAVSKTAALNVALEVSFKVNEDINGDGKGGDTLKQTVPLSLLAGKTANVTLNISRGTSSVVDASAGASPGNFVFSALDRNDALGDKKDFYGTDYGTGVMLFDVDGNHFLRPGDDQTLIDANHNGWPDSTESSYLDPALNTPAAPSSSSVDGIVTAVDLAAYTLDLMLNDGSIVHVTLDAHALIAPVGPSDILLGQVVLDPSLVGRKVHVDSVPTSTAGTVIGLRVVLLEAAPTK